MQCGARHRRRTFAPASLLLAATGYLLHADCAVAVTFRSVDDSDADGFTADGASPSPTPAAPAISESSSKQITAVLDTLKDIVASVKSEQTKEQELFNQFDAWCKNEDKRLADALGTAQTQGEDNDVSNAEKEAANAQLSHTLDELKASIQETNDVIAQAASIRGEESDKYDDDIQLNRESLASIGRAIEIIQKVHGHSGLLQSALAKRYQVSEPGESSFVLGVMKGLQEKLEKSKRSLEDDEANKKSMHDSFMSIKKKELDALKTEEAAKKNIFTKNRIDLVEVKHGLENAKKKVEDLTALIKETDDRCAAKRASWKERKADREQELAALEEAIQTIKSGAPAAGTPKVLAQGTPRRLTDTPPAPSLLQVSAGRRRPRVVAGADAGVPSAVALLQRSEGRKSDSTREVVEGLIKLMEKQQADEKEKQDYCKDALSTKEKEKVAEEDGLKQLAAAIGHQSGQVDMLGKEVTELEQTIKDLKTGLDQATALRKKEKESFEAQSKDRKLAVKVLHQAMQVLKEFYASKDKAALSQLAATPVSGAPAGLSNPPQTWTEGSGAVKDLHSSVAVEMMAKVAGEIEKEETDAAKEETDAAAAFEKQQADNRAEFDRLMEEITDRVKRKATLVVRMNSDKEAEAQHKADLGTINGQIKTLHEECDELIKNFEKRRQARKFEIGQLRDVIDIVSGSQSADAVFSAS